MHFQGFPNCCKAKIVAGWPEGDTADSICEIKPGETRIEQAKITKKVIGDWALSKMSHAWNTHQALLITTLTEEQKKARSVLHRLGWSHSKWCTKFNNLGPDYNKGSKIRVYIFEVYKYPEIRKAVERGMINYS